jgi:hypothetical protein
MNKKDILLLSILTFLTIAIWTVYDIYHVAITSTISIEQQNLTKDFSPTFDTEVLELLRSRSE